MALCLVDWLCWRVDPIIVPNTSLHGIQMANDENTHLNMCAPNKMFGLVLEIFNVQKHLLKEEFSWKFIHLTPENFFSSNV